MSFWIQGLLLNACYALVRANLLNVTLTGLISSHPQVTIGGQYIIPAIDLAVKEVAEHCAINITFVPIHSPAILTCADMEDNMHLVAEYFYRIWDRQSLLVIISGGCEVTELLAQLAREWNKLILLSLSIISPVVRNRLIYPTALSVAYIDYVQAAQVFFDVFRLYQWVKVAVVYDSNLAANPAYRTLMEVLKQMNDKVNNEFALSYFALNASVHEEYEPLLKVLQTQRRIILVLIRQNKVRQLMIEAYKLGMTTDDYVYLTFLLFPNDRRFGTLDWKLGDQNDLIAKLAFKNVYQLVVSCFDFAESLHSAGEYIKNEGVKKFSAAYGPNETVNPYAWSSYFAVLILGQKLSELTKNNSFVSDGILLAKTFLGQTFSIAGINLTLNYKGFLDGNICIKSFDMHDDLLKPILRVGSYETKRFEPMNQWMNQTAQFPPDEPRCGFKGDKDICDKSLSLSNVVLVVLVTLALTSAAAVMLYIKNARANERHSWLFQFREISFALT